MEVTQLRATFKVESASKQGKFYNVTLEPLRCDCPHFLVRLLKEGGECKHILAVRDYLTKRNKGHAQDIKAYVKKKGEVDALDLLDLYSEQLVNELLRSGELIEEHGKIRIVE
ncbi:MAG: SWIM zinc finger family protein [Nanoarchaeota archaeon]